AGDEHLGPGDAHAAVGGRNRAGAQQRQVAAGLRLGQAHRGQPFAADQRRQEAGLDVRRRVRLQAGDRAGEQARVHRPRMVGAHLHLGESQFQQRGQALATPFGIAGQGRPAIRDVAPVGLGESVGCTDAPVDQPAALQVADRVERCQHLGAEAAGLGQHRFGRVQVQGGEPRDALPVVPRPQPRAEEEGDVIQRRLPRQAHSAGQNGEWRGSVWIVNQRSPGDAALPALPPQRPQPPASTPPTAICASSCTVGPLMSQMPDWIRAATRQARETSRLNTAADRPYSVSLATSTAWSSPSTRITETRLPNDSSEYRRICLVTPSITVGCMIVPSIWPPQAMRAPLDTASSISSRQCAAASGENSAPSGVSFAAGSPALSVAALAATIATNSSATWLSTTRRSVDMQVWPWFMNAPNTAPSRAASRSASSSTSNGALPPSSSSAGLSDSAASLATMRPTRVEPVKLTRRTRGSRISAATIS